MIKKIIKSCLIAGSLLYANAFALENDKINKINDISLQKHKTQAKKAQAKSQKYNNDYLEQARKNYEQGNYKKAYDMAISYAEKNPYSIEAWNLAGDSAVGLKDYDRAIAAFDCVLILDENNIHAHIESAKIYAAGGNTELLKLEINSLLQLEILDENDKKSFEEFLKILNGPKGIFYGGVGVGMFYDNNPFAENKNRKKYLKTKESAGRYISVNAGYEHHFSDFYSINIDTGFYNKNYAVDKDATHEAYPNFRILSVYFSQKGSFETSSISLNTSYSHMYYQDKQFLQSPSVGINFSKSLPNGFGFDIGADYTHNLFLGDYKDKKSLDVSNDYYHASVYSSLRSSFKNNLIYFRIYAAQDRKIGEARVEDDITTEYNGYGLTISYSKFFDKFYANIGYSLDHNQFIKEDYKNRKRKDFTHRAFTGFTYALSKQIGMSLNLTYSKRFSNINGENGDVLAADYTYDQFYGQFGFRYSF